jgi:hypothetical protein
MQLDAMAITDMLVSLVLGSWKGGQYDRQWEKFPI